MQFTEALIEFLDARENAQRLAGSKAYGKGALASYLQATENLNRALTELVAPPAAVTEALPTPRTTKRRG